MDSQKILILGFSVCNLIFLLKFVHPRGRGPRFQVHNYLENEPICVQHLIFSSVVQLQNNSIHLNLFFLNMFHTQRLWWWRHMTVTTHCSCVLPVQPTSVYNSVANTDTLLSWWWIILGKVRRTYRKYAIWYHVVRWRSTDVSEEYIGSIFRVEGLAEQETSVKVYGKSFDFQ
jgi:hypothetical protein